MITMLIDHTAYAFVPVDSSLHLVMRTIGRFAFPIFAFFIAEGVIKTSDVKKYTMRLALFGVVSEIFFDRIFFGQFVYNDYQNVYFTLLFGAIACGIMKSTKLSLLQVLGVAACAYCAYYLKTDYGALGVILIVVFYMAFAPNEDGSLVDRVSKTPVMVDIRNFMTFIYNGERGKQFKYLNYAFYPVHLLILGVIKYGL